MKVLITGTSGFIGGHLLSKAQRVYGSDVYSLSSSKSSNNCLKYKSIVDFDLTRESINVIKNSEILVHVGAFIPKRRSEANSINECNTNIVFTENLLNLPWEKLKKIIFASTIDVYAECKNAICEDSAVVPASLYGLSKYYCEKMTSIFADTKAIRHQILRIGHVYGPGEEKYSKVIPNAIRCAIEGKQLELWGDGKELRSFIHVDDVVDAFLNAFILDESPGIINVVGGRRISILELLLKVIELSGADVGISQKAFSGMARDLVFNNSKLKQYLLPQEVNFEDGIREEIDYFRKSYSKENESYL